MFANTQPLVSNELGPFHAIAGNLLAPFPGNFRKFQAILGNFRQFYAVSGNFLAIFGGQNPRQKPVSINNN